MAPNNPLSSWGNEKTMNLNSLILTNIQSSPYFKVQLFELKTFHEVVDEIYYRVDHLEPWEKGSRKTAGQTGMCGGVRGVGAGGIVSSAYCLLFKLFTLKLTKKQVNNLITHSDSPFIRGMGFMFIRYSQPPSDLWDWYEPYLDDDEELDVKAGGGHMMTVGDMLRQWLVKLEWYSTLFPRIPVPIQKDLSVKLRGRPSACGGFSGYGQEEVQQEPQHIPDDQLSFGEAEKSALGHRGGGRGGGHHNNNVSNSNGNYSRRSPPSRRRSPPRHSPHSRDDFSRDLERERDRQRREKDKDRHRDEKKRSSRSRSKSRERERRRSRSKSGSRSDRWREEKEGREKDREREDREREKEREDREREKDRESKKDKEHYHRKEKEHKEHKKDREHKKEKKSHKHKKDKDRGRDRSKERERVARDSPKERYGKGERDVSKERYGKGERDVSRERYGKGERDVSRDRYGKGEREASRERYGKAERDISREKDRHRGRDRSRERDRKYS